MWHFVSNLRFDTSCFSPPSAWGWLEFKLNSSLGSELFSSPGLLLAHGVPNPRVSWSAWSAQPQRRVSLPREGGDVRSKIIFGGIDANHQPCLPACQVL